jgi:glyceraldehyde-3-phosphate dehydrogenase type I
LFNTNKDFFLPFFEDKMVRTSAMAGIAAGAAVYGGLEMASAFVAPTSTATSVAAPAGAAAMQAPQMASSSSSWATAAAATAAVGVMGSAAYARRSAPVAKAEADVEAGLGASGLKIPIGKGGFIGATGESVTVISTCPKTGRAREQQVHATAMGAGADTKVAIFGFGRIGRNVLRCWLKREKKPFDLISLNVGSMGAKTAAHLLKYDTVLGTLPMDVSFDEESITVGPHKFTLVFGRKPEEMPWGKLGVEVVIESTGAFNSLDGGSKHLEGGAKKVVLTAPGKDCPTYVVGVNEGDYDPANDTVISNASCTTNGMASVCKVLDESFEVQYGLMTTTHSYTGDQMILDGRHRDLRRARAGACNIVPTSTGAAKAVAAVLPKYKGKLNGIALRVPTPNVSVVDLVVKVGKECTGESVNAALKKAADGPMKGIINFEEQPLVSSDFLQTDYSNSVDAALTMVMGGDLVKVVMWYDNEWGYSQRVLDMTQIVCEKQ